MKNFFDVFYNNIGFYTGCLMWAAYIKGEPKQKILSNPCLGLEYDEEHDMYIYHTGLAFESNLNVGQFLFPRSSNSKKNAYLTIVQKCDYFQMSLRHRKQQTWISIFLPILLIHNTF